MGSEPIGPFWVHYKGLFDFDAIYAAVVDWAKNYGYFWHESLYKHKVPYVTGAEQALRWNMDKEVTEYIRYEISVSVDLFELTELEVEVDGKKKMLSNGHMKMKISSTLVWDWQKRLAKAGWLGRKLGKYYEKVWSKELSSIYGDTLWYRTVNLQQMVKKVLDLQTKKHTYKRYLGEN